MMHLIRPDFLWLFIPAMFIMWVIKRKGRQDNQWRNACDPHLMPHLTFSNLSADKKWPMVMFSLALSIAIIAMAGPSWRRSDVPLYHGQTPLVILLDMSYEMNEKDIKPSRLERAKFKIIDLLKAKKGGQTALVAFTKEPFVVTPLTEDAKTIVNLLKVLEPSMMPVQGHNVFDALAQARKMIAQAGYDKGQILLITSEAGKMQQGGMQKVLSLAGKMKNDSILVSVLGVGASSGDQMLKIAKAGGGIYEMVTPTNADIQKIARIKIGYQEGSKSKQQARLWQDEGHWFILLLLPLMIIVFRRGCL